MPTRRRRHPLALAAVLWSVLAAPALSAQGYTLTPLDVPGATFTRASGINAGGQIVGYYNDRLTGMSHGFVGNAGAFSTVDVPGALYSKAYGINNSGQIVGVYQDAIAGASQAATTGVHSFLATPTGTTTTPEPVSLALLAAGLGGLGGVARRRARLSA